MNHKYEFSVLSRKGLIPCIVAMGTYQYCVDMVRENPGYTLYSNMMDIEVSLPDSSKKGALEAIYT